MADNRITREDALAFHLDPTLRKWEVQATAQRDRPIASSTWE